MSNETHHSRFELLGYGWIMLIVKINFPDLKSHILNLSNIEQMSRFKNFNELRDVIKQLGIQDFFAIIPRLEKMLQLYLFCLWYS